MANQMPRQSLKTESITPALVITNEEISGQIHLKPSLLSIRMLGDNTKLNVNTVITII